VENIAVFCILLCEIVFYVFTTKVVIGFWKKMWRTVKS